MPTDDRPNILLLTGEDLSLRIGAFGDNVANTPNIDNFENAGVKFPNMFMTSGDVRPAGIPLSQGVIKYPIMQETCVHETALRSISPDTWHFDGPVPYNVESQYTFRAHRYGFQQSAAVTF